MKYIILVALCTAIILAAYVLKPIYGIRFTLSPSLPYKIFISKPTNQIVKGSYASFVPSQSEELLIAKQIIGVAGDSISIYNNNFYINDQYYGSLQKQSKTGILLHPVTEEIIPEDYLFVYGSHPESFDSRYQEFGLIHISQVKEVLWPLF